MHPVDWIAPDWPAPANVGALITTRNGGMSMPPYDSFNLGTHVGDDPGAVARNRALLREVLPGDPHWLRQVHGARVARLDEAAAAAEPEADAAVARRTGTVCAVLIADCLPVLLCDRDGSVVACAHAGWRGLSAGVLPATLRAMDCPPDRVLAYLGPAIGPRAFEVGADVRDAFVRVHAEDAECFRTKTPTSEGEPKWWADLPELARRGLQRSGVTRVYGGGDCTHAQSTRFFSHRRDGRSGRHAALIWMR